MDTVQEANSGHPGLPLGMAPAAYLLFQRIMRFNPRDPAWPDRDRFVLSAGHGSALLYVMLHLSGYDVSLDDLKRFRQWGSNTPGHPELRPRQRHPGRRGHDRPARPGLRQRRRHGARRALPARALRQGRPAPSRLRDRLRRRPHGGHRLRGRLARRAPAPQPARLPLRRQRHLARRADVAGASRRTRPSASRPTAGTSRRSPTSRTWPRSSRRSTGPCARTSARRWSGCARSSATRRRTSRAPAARTARRSARTRCASRRRRWAWTPTCASTSPRTSPST